MAARLGIEGVRLYQPDARAVRPHEGAQARRHRQRHRHGGGNPSFEYLCGAAANAGLAAFTKGMGKGSREHGVRVLGVHPPNTRTERIVTLMKAQAKAKFGDESRYAELMGNVIEPQQVGDTVAFLASARAGQLSGIVLNLGY